MKRILTALLFILFSAVNTYASDIIQGKYCYTYGDSETLKEARELARKLAIRNAIESYRIYVASISKIKDFHVKDDLIDTISSAYLKNVKVTAHTEKDRTICETIESLVNAADIDALIGQLKKKEDKGKNTDIQGMLRDPEFKALPIEERRKVMIAIDQDFADLPRTEQDKILAKLSGTEQKEYLFMVNLFDSLHMCQWAKEAFRTDNPGDTARLITDLMVQNNRFKDAQSSLSEYLIDVNANDPAALSDGTIAGISRGVSVGIEILVNANDSIIPSLEEITNMMETAKLRSLTSDEQLQLVELLSNQSVMGAKIQSQKKQGWDLIFKSLTLAPYVILDYSIEPKDRKGPVIFRVTADEKKDLIARIDRLFGDDIKKFHTARKLQKQKKKHDPEDVNSLILGVTLIRRSLSAINYGDLSMLNENL